jgi:hypothetical protein
MRSIRSISVAGAAVAAAAVGGAAIANAATSTSSSSASSSSTGAPAAAPPKFPAHGTAAHEDAERPVTGTVADKAKAAAVKYLGGGTATDVTTDYNGSGYEVDVSKNGTRTEVHLDRSFSVQSGPGGMHGSPGGPAPGGSYAPAVSG